MTRLIHLAAASLCLTLLFQTQSSSAQQPPKPQQPAAPASEDVVRITTQLVQIDAVVTDKKGEHVDALGEEDFELSVDGKRQTLTFFKLIKLPDLKQPDKPGAQPKPAAAPAPMPGKAIAPEDVKRTLAFVVDDLGLSFESVYQARQAIKKFVDEQMQEGDLVGIIRTGRGAGSFQQFTTDKRVLHAAIEKLQWNPYSRDMIPRFSSPEDDAAARTGNDNEAAREASERFEDFRTTVFSVGTLGALNFVVRGLRELSGRKTAILISDGFPLFGRNRDNNQVLEQVRQLTDLANRSSVVIYSLDAKGLQVLGPTAADGGGNLSGPQFAERMQRMSRQNFDSQEGLSFLARETGGFAVLNNNDLNLGIRQALKDQQSYYLIGFDPEDEKFDRKYHSIKLKVARPGLQVRTRAGFIGRPETGARPEAPRTRDGQVLAALFSPFGARDLALQMTSFFFNSPNTARKLKSDPESISFVRSLFHIDASKLTFIDAPDGKKATKLEIITFTFDENGAVIEQHGQAFSLELNAEQYKAVTRKGLSYTDDFVIKKPGAYQFRAVIRDPETERLGSAGQFIQVPDLAKKRLAMSGLVLAAGPNDNSAPLPDDVQPTPGVRRFPRTSILDYGGVIYNPTLDPKTGTAQLQIVVEIYRDGKPIHQSQPRSMELTEGGAPQRPAFGGRLKLTSLPPGDFLLHVVIEDSLAKKKYARVEQWMDFSVR